jgi:hypothetical protein
MKEIAFSEKLGEFCDSIQKETIEDYREHEMLVKGEMN